MVREILVPWKAAIAVNARERRNGRHVVDYRIAIYSRQYIWARKPTRRSDYVRRGYTPVSDLNQSIGASEVQGIHPARTTRTLGSRHS